MRIGIIATGNMGTGFAEALKDAHDVWVGYRVGPGQGHGVRPRGPGRAGRERHLEPLLGVVFTLGSGAVLKVLRR